MEIFDNKDKARTLDLFLYNAVDEIRTDAKDLADNIIKDKKENAFYINLYKDNFISSFEYVREKIRFIKDIGIKFNLELSTIDLIDEILDLNTNDHIIEYFIPSDFLYKENRYMTDQELKARDAQLTLLVKKYISDQSRN